ncbi:MAG: flagellar filament capping protein FliD [Helicobacteraceae bacterium]
MAGTISNLGLTYGGANSNLTGNTIQQLKEAEKKVLLKSAKDELEDVYKKQKDTKTIKKALEALRDAAKVFSGDLTYLKTKTTTKGEGGTVSVSDGLEPQEGKIHVNNIAKKSIVESKGFLNKDAIINPSQENKVLTLKSGGKEYKINVTPQMTLSDLQDAINTATNGAVKASIINTGGKTEPYRLILESKQTGESQKIEIDKSAKNAFDLELKTIQEAKDASFIYNGVEIKRSSNKIDDLYVGVKITLLKDNADINFKVERDLGKLSEKMQAFAKAYNEAVKILHDATKYDEKAKTVGVFQGDSRINSIHSALNKILFADSDYSYQKKIKTDGKNEEIINVRDNLAHFGFTLNKEGLLTFTPSKFEKAMSEDPKKMEKFLKGTKTITPSVYNSKPMDGFRKDFDVKTGDITINNVKIGGFTLKASNNEVQNAQVIASAINKHTKETGVTAKVNPSNGQITLEDKLANTIDLKTADYVRGRLGLEAGLYKGSVVEKEGVFKKLDSYLNSLLSGKNSTFSTLDEGLSKSEKRLTKDLQSTIDALNAKYETMSQQFLAYNKIISGLEASFASLKMQIQAQIAAKS